jgi:hypothetical protein
MACGRGGAGLTAQTRVNTDPIRWITIGRSRTLARAQEAAAGRQWRGFGGARRLLAGAKGT